ncbi:MAG: hypothetical protein Q4F05_03240 [bacterium]|nr:hypothetical protein [bacterium]
MLSTVLSATLLLGGTSAFAESQTETVTSNKKNVTCYLDCTWKITGNDRATAKTNWDGLSNYKVGVQLYQCYNAWSDYKKVTSDTDPKSAYVQGSVSGVWKYKSKHTVINTKNNNSTSTVCPYFNTKITNRGSSII